MSRSLRFFRLSGGWAALAAGLSLTACGTDDPNDLQRFQGNGRLEMRRIDIAVKYPGRLAAVAVREGDTVQVGQTLATQDPAEWQAQLAAAQAAQARAQEARSRAGAELAARQALADLAGLELTHAERLQQQDLVAPAEVERRQAQVRGEWAAVAAASAARGEARAAVQEAQAQIQRLQTVLDDLVLRAPVSGRIEYRVGEPGSVLPSGGRVLTLLDPTDCYLTVFLPGAVAARLQLNDEARIVLSGPQQTRWVLPARVSFVAGEAQFTPKYVETSDERDRLSYRVRLTVPEAVALTHQAWLKAGTTAVGHVRTNPQTPWPADLTVRLPGQPA